VTACRDCDKDPYSEDVRAHDPNLIRDLVPLARGQVPQCMADGSLDLARHVGLAEASDRAHADPAPTFSVPVRCPAPRVAVDWALMTLQFALLTLVASALFVAASGLRPEGTWLPWTLTGAWRAAWAAIVTTLTAGCNVALTSDQPLQAVGVALVTASPTWMLLLAQALSEWVKWRRSRKLATTPQPLNIFPDESSPVERWPS